MLNPVTCAYTLKRIRFQGVNQWQSRLTLRHGDEPFATTYLVLGDNGSPKGQAVMIETFAYAIMKLGSGFLLAQGRK